MEKYAVIYLDLLGFKSFLLEDPDAALVTLEDFHSVLATRQGWEDQGHCIPAFLAVDSFDFLLPMSDSVFILSKDPAKVAQQLSTFLSSVFLLSGGAFSDGMADPSNVLRQCVKNYQLDASGEGQVTSYWEKWYPVLFRGGIAYGDVRVVLTPAICKGERVRIPNLAGPAVAKAVSLEQEGFQGPRLFCDRKFVKHLRCPATKYLRPVGKEWELLWPAFNYQLHQDEKAESYALNDLFFPALALWNHYRGEKPERHYEEFLNLIVRSHLAFAQCASDSDLVNDHLYHTLNGANLEVSDSPLNAQLVFSNT